MPPPRQSSRWSATSWPLTGSYRARWIRGSPRPWRKPWPSRQTLRVTRRVFGVLLAAALLVAGCADGRTPRALVVGAGTDPDSTVLAELYAAALRYYGSRALVEHSPYPIAQLDTAQVNVVPGLTGDLLQRFAPGTNNVLDDKNV